MFDILINVGPLLTIQALFFSTFDIQKCPNINIELSFLF